MRAKKTAGQPIREAKMAARPEVTVSVTGPEPVCDAAATLLKAVFAHLGVVLFDVKMERGKPAPANPAPKAEKPKLPAGRPVTKAEVRQRKAWRKKGASYGEIARRAGRPRSVVTAHVQKEDTKA